LARIRIVLIALIAIMAAPGMARPADQGFQAWVAQFRQQALAAGIRPATFDRAFADIAPIPRIIDLDHVQPEVKLTFSQYVARLVSADRQEGVRAHLAEDRAVLDDIGSSYRVQPRFIVALWGIETDFGRVSGDYPVIAALATLAYDGRRASLFEHELIAALRIVERDHIDPRAMRGSWAGAMGQSQFMPSSFLAYAVSWQGNGRPDIWTRREDVFASIANYLSRLGWRDDETWGRPVIAPSEIGLEDAGFGTRKPLAEWRQLGIRRIDGSALPSGPTQASLLLPEGEGGPALLAYANFRTLLKWNNSQAFAASVGYLADSGEFR
jgi:membrane-bound lytic murein transglycosylase B